MNNETDMAFAVIEPWQAALYRALQLPDTLNRAVRSVEHFDGHRRTLEARGDAAAVAGLATPIRQALIKLAGVAAASPRLLARKVAILVAYRWAWAGHPMAVALFDAAIVADVAALKLGADEEARLRRRLRGER